MCRRAVCVYVCVCVYMYMCVCMPPSQLEVISMAVVLSVGGECYGADIMIQMLPATHGHTPTYLSYLWVLEAHR